MAAFTPNRLRDIAATHASMSETLHHLSTVRDMSKLVIYHASHIITANPRAAEKERPCGGGGTGYLANAIVICRSEGTITSPLNFHNRGHKDSCAASIDKQKTRQRDKSKRPWPIRIHMMIHSSFASCRVGRPGTRLLPARFISVRRFMARLLPCAVILVYQYPRRHRAALYAPAARM